MAFGKDPKVLGNVTPFGGSARQQAAFASRRRKHGGGTKLVFKHQFQPSLYVPDHGRIIPGSFFLQFLDDDGNIVGGNYNFYNYIEHWHGVYEKSSFCSAGPYRFQKAKASDCCGCDIYWEDWNIRKQTGNKNKPKRMSMREMYAYTWMDFGNFHKVEDRDGQGQVRVNPNTKQPYTSWEKCTAPQCEGCTLGLETKQGHVQPWPMGKRHFGTLNAYADQIGLGCVTCGSRDTVSTLCWCCGNQPDCGETLIDMASTGLNPEQIYDRIEEPQICPRCQVKSFMVDIYECRTCTPRGAAAQRATLYDVDLQVRRQKNKDEQGTQLLVVGTGDPSTIHPAFAEMAKPLALDKMYGPTDINLQASLFRIQQQPVQPQQPAPQQQPQQHYQAYQPAPQQAAPQQDPLAQAGAVQTGFTPPHTPQQ